MIAALTAAFSSGGRPERAGGILLIVAALASPAVQSSRFGEVEVGIAIVDVLLLLALVAVALTGHRIWPKFAAAFQFVCVLTHVARLIVGPVQGDVYASMLVVWSYPVVLSLLLGALIETKRVVSTASERYMPEDHMAAFEDAPLSGRRPVPAANDTLLLEKLLNLHGLDTESAVLADKLIRYAGSFAAATAASPALLRSWRIDDRAVEALAFARSTTRTSLKRKLETRQSLATGKEAIDYLHFELAHLQHEQFRVLYLNSRFRLIYDQVHSDGSVAEAPVFPREVVKTALEAGAVYLILAHNHPGGDPTPSRNDIDITRTISTAGRAMGITVVDHFVISAAGHVSMRSVGLI